MAAQGGQAFASGEYGRAADLYRNAFRSEPVPAYLFGAARAEHLAGHIDAALDQYRKYLALKEGNAKREKSAGEYVAELEFTKAEGVAAEGQKAARAGMPKVAVGLYEEAFRLAPARWDWLLAAGIAAQDAGDSATAREHLQRYLRESPDRGAGRKQAAARLEVLQQQSVMAAPRVVAAPSTPVAPAIVAVPVVATPVVAKPVVKPTVSAVVVAEPVVPAAPATADWRTPVGWTAVAAGGAAVVTAVALAVVASGAQTDLDGYKAAGGWDASRITPHDARAEQLRINNLWTGAIVVGAIGAAIGVTGALLVHSSPRATVAVAPNATGMVIGLAW